MRELGGAKRYFKYAECEKGQILVNNGRYIRDFQGKFGIQHELMDDDGVITVLNSAGQLNWLIDTYVQVGDHIRIAYDGMSVLEAGPMKGKDAHNFKVHDMSEESEPESESLDGSDSDNDFDL